MIADLRFQLIRRAVTELVANETEVAGRLERAQQLCARHPDTLAALEPLRPLTHSHRDELATYLKMSGAAEPSDGVPRSLPVSSGSDALSDALRDLCLAFHNCALGYAMLFEMALRLYEPPLREIAPRNLKAHADAALSTAQLLPGVVAWQLAQDGLYCACICPMCSLGACGCVDYGTQTLTAAWCDEVTTKTNSRAFVLQQTPRPESQLARAGVQKGEVVLAVDGQDVRDFVEVQAAIRKHSLGDEVCLLIQRGSENPRELKVRHVSDYPKS